MAASAAIDLEASLECELDSQPISIQANHGVIVVDVQSSKAALSMIRFVRKAGTLRSTASRINQLLLGASQRLEVRVDGSQVVAMGHGTDSGLLRLVGLKHVRIWPSRLLRRRRLQ